MNAAGSEDKYRQLVERSLTGVFIQQDGKYVYANDSFLEIHGYTRDELTGRPFADLVAPEDRRRVEQLVADRVAGKPAPRRYEIRRLKKTGETVWCEMMVDRIEFQGKPAIMGNVIEISERKRIEQELADANRRLSSAVAELRNIQRLIIQSERLSALGQMASGIAHDFNNALMPVLGFTELLISNQALLADKNEATAILKDIYSAASEAANTLKRLREFYRPSDDIRGYVRVDIARLIAATEEHTRPRWNDAAQAAGIVIKFCREVQGDPAVMGNESQLCEMLTNLVLNAIEAMPRGGVITIRSRKENDWVVLEVGDTGSGMAEEALHRWMEPFFSTKGPANMGIGLSVAYGIIRRHGGTISVQSESGKGATFVIRLPCEVFGPATEEAGKKTSGPLHVLVIDDDVWSRRLIQRYLEADNHVVATASGGKEGMAKFQEGSFDLVITDWAIPDMSGDEVASVVKAAKPGVGVILLTGFGDLVRDTGGPRRHIDLILGKPLTVSELRDAIRNTMQAASVARPLPQ